MEAQFLAQAAMTPIQPEAGAHHLIDDKVTLPDGVPLLRTLIGAEPVPVVFRAVILNSGRGTSQEGAEGRESE